MQEAAYIGIDPGMNGCCAALRGQQVSLLKHDGATEQDQWQWIMQFIGEPCYALIEQQTARPTWIPDKTTEEGWRQTVLASTVTLYGSYRNLATMLMCADISYQDCPPQRWQKWTGIEPRHKGEKDHQWKGRLKVVAQSMYPELTVTLWMADALLIAAYCKHLAESQNGGAQRAAGDLPAGPGPRR